MKITDFIPKEFLKINYSMMLSQCKEKGMSEIDLINDLLDVHEKIYNSRLEKPKDEIENPKKHNNELIFYRSEIELLRDKKRNHENQLNIERQLQFIQYNTDEDTVLNDTQKLIYLHELGVLEYLQNRGIMGVSNNSIAGIISKIVGMKQTSAQPLVNSLLNSRDVIQKNHPYSNQKNVESIKYKLKNLGFRTRD